MADDAGHIAAGIFLDLVQQFLTGFADGHVGYALELFKLLGGHFLDIVLTLINGGLPFIQVRFALFDLLKAMVDIRALLLKAFIFLDQGGAAFLNVVLGFIEDLDGVVLRVGFNELGLFSADEDDVLRVILLLPHELLIHGLGKDRRDNINQCAHGKDDDDKQPNRNPYRRRQSAFHGRGFH